eukprot:4524299-Pyramimonas_sp.AAC.1
MQKGPSHDYVVGCPSAEGATTTRRKITPSTLTRRDTSGADIHVGSEAHGENDAVGGPRPP